jgi:hypothetical protein
MNDCKNSLTVYQNENSPLNKALFEIQKEIENIKKDAKNPYYNSTYATLEAVLEITKPLLNKHNILLTQKCEGNKLTTCLIHFHSGEEISSTLDLINIPDMQKLGSAVTYARRYTLQSILAIGSEDDDANEAIKPNEVKKAQEFANNSRKPDQDYRPIHEPHTDVKYPVFGFCSKCFAPMYLSKKGTSIYCSNYRNCSYADRADYKGQPQLPTEINTYEKWMHSKIKPMVKNTEDIKF